MVSSRGKAPRSHAFLTRRRPPTRRKFPAYYYELNFHIPNTGKTLTIVMLDTVMLCGNSDDFANAEPREPQHVPNAQRQLAWLQERLARSRADFLLVAGHYPVWSVSKHGPTACLLEKLHPLLIKHKATAYLCGHDHNMQVRSRGSQAPWERLLQPPSSAVHPGGWRGLRGERRWQLPGP